MSDSAWIIDATTETFEQAVVVRSNELPVVVDFWAAWCGPCRQLGPVLESLADEYAGKFLLAKVDVDAHQQLAVAFGVQSIPHVIAIKDKKIVDEFRGALPEPLLREWLNRIVPSPADELLKAGEAIESADAAAAEAKYREALTLSPESAPARIALARALAAQQRFDEAGDFITQLEQRGFLEPEAERIKSLLDVGGTAASAGGVAAAQQAANENPDDLSLKLPLADALAASGHYREALEVCLDVIQRDKAGVGVAAKETMVNILNLVDDAELAGEYRRKLASALY